MTTHVFVVTLALIGGVIIITALLSGLIERTRIPQVGVFLALGAVLGSAGLGLFDVTLDTPILRVVATVSLVLVLFTDALNLDLREVRQNAGLAAIVLGPGTLLCGALITLAAWWLLGLSWPAAAILGAALASTDPVLLRGIFRNPALPTEVRQALRLESGLNDVVLLPPIFVAMGYLSAHAMAGPELGSLAVRMLVLGPGAGVLVGLAGVAALDLVRRRVGVRRDYESLYSLGVAFLAYAAAESVHGSGFLAAFAAGITIVALDVDLCECFLEYGETTAEMALLLTFVLLGTSLIWTGFDGLDGRTAAFAALAIAARPLAFIPALALTKLPWRSRWLIAWLGPRGLSSLLLAMVPIFAGVEGLERLFAACCLVVLCSVVLHGGSLTLLMRRAGDAATEPDPGADGPRITLEEVRRIQTEASAPVVLLDVRRDRSVDASGDGVLDGTVRVDPDEAVAGVRKLDLPRDAWLVAFCA